VTEPIRVAIVEDQRDIREGLRFLIDGTPGYRCAGVYPSMEEALAAVTPATTDIVLTDLGLPGMTGVEGIGRFKERFPALPLVALTVYDDDDRILAALCAGASGYLLKKTPPARLVEGLADACGGGAPMSPDIAARVIALFRQFRPPARADYALTPHETRLLALLAQGHSYKTAAAELGNSVNTVAFHLKSIYLKLQVHSKSEAVAKALREGLVR
jgi:DNA-binding NarL/FixJ family response regulator